MWTKPPFLSKQPKYFIQWLKHVQAKNVLNIKSDAKNIFYMRLISDRLIPHDWWAFNFSIEQIVRQHYYVSSDKMVYTNTS